MDTEYVRTLFDYDPDTGNLLWKKRTGRKAKIGNAAGYKEPGRYITIKHFGVCYYAHRLVWLWHGFQLPRIIDHINLDKHDNRIENLRAVTPSQSQFNHRLRRTNTSGVKGVSWSKRLKRWIVRVHANNRVYPLGMFKDLELAELVAIEGRAKYHGEYARNE